MIIFSWIFAPKIYRYINKKKHPFSGKIETFKDVNDFIVNYNLFHFTDKDENYNYYIVTKTYTIWNTKTITIPKGIYKTEKYDNYWYSIHNRINEPIRAFIWNHKDAINAQLDVEKITEEKDRKEKERILNLNELDKNIKNIAKN
jgi:hypothetical protein